MASPGFFNQNANRAYPFLLGTVNRPSDGPLSLRQLPNDIVVDCGFLLGPQAGFTAEHTVRLQSIRRRSDVFYFTFVCDTDALYDVPLVFTRHVLDEDYVTEFVDSDESAQLANSASVSVSDGHDACGEPLWSGFLVTGKMASLQQLLATDGEIATTEAAATVEPGLLHNLADTFVSSVSVANDDRTRADASEDCDVVEWPYEVGVVHVHESCLRGEIRLKAGYNAIVRQNDLDNSITLGAGVGFGEGEPCGEIPLFADEVPPDAGQLLSGGPRCDEVLRSIDGIGGRLFNIIAAQGVTVTAYPAENRVVIGVDMSGLALCFTQISQVSESA